MDERLFLIANLQILKICCNNKRFGSYKGPNDFVDIEYELSYSPKLQAIFQLSYVCILGTQRTENYLNIRDHIEIEE